ncbi:flavin monoamine oxidase family protein [Rhodococcus xishaensis]|uniref:FAD-dependent oxidoreductase n=1 Tax=Rhodococcus xishaensis TaxID=2487364 RepID=A0A3S3AAZ3_9NOCA|nr:NAD(P)/FAD-dependent oxidoreductase [Rhodococcus xishaensis]RVW00178.1 FAD-dependent oxidoreductase [Rhodococcus xishaensis]
MRPRRRWHRRRHSLQRSATPSNPGASHGLLSGLGVRLLGVDVGTGGNARGGRRPQRVIVVGAGAAGLTAANALTTAGVETVVLEARDRLGGRVWPEEVGGVPVDLGGAWIVGPSGNPVACVLNREGIGWQSAESLGGIVRGYDGVLHREMPESDLWSALAAVGQFEEACPELVAALGPNASLEEGFDAFLTKAGLSEPARRYAAFALHATFEGNEAESADRIALTPTTSEAFDEGGSHFPDGSFRGLITALARGVDVRLETIVSRVEYSEGGVSIETSNGTEHGSHVIVTVPLGVLKAGRIEFSPALPADKIEAIERLGMGDLEKVVLRYEQPFWPDPGANFLFYLGAQPGEFPLIVDYTSFAGGKPTLIALYCGAYRRAIADMPDAAIAARFAEVVAEIAGHEGAAPSSTHVTRWTSDPFAMGSYSYYRAGAGATAAERDTLGAPVGDQLLFAGEATSGEHYGYIHGAMLSGAREAERLLDERPGQGVVLESGLLVKEGCNEAAS